MGTLINGLQECSNDACFAMIIEKYSNFIDANRMEDPVERLKALKRLVQFIWRLLLIY